MPTINNKAPTAAETKANAPKGDIVAVPNPTIGVISAAIMGAFNECTPNGLALDDATAAAKAAREAEEGSRETVLIRMAELAGRMNWELGVIMAGAEEAVKQYTIADGKNRNPTTLGQWKVELIRAMNPGCRDYVKQAFADSRELWKAERAAADVAREANKAARKLDPKAELEPIDDTLLKAFGKRYHMVAGSNGILSGHIDAASDKPKAIMSHEEAADPHMLAATRAQVVREDPKAAARTLAKLVETIEGIYAEFPADALKTMLRFANGLNADTLSKAKEQRQRATARAATPNAKPAAKPAASTLTDEQKAAAADDVIA